MKKLINLIICCLCLAVLCCACNTDNDSSSYQSSSNKNNEKDTAENDWTDDSDSEQSSWDDIQLTETPDSTCFSAIGYEDGTLVVEFRDSGSRYAYFDVERSTWKQFKSADSLGSYFNEYIKGSYDYERLQ